MRSVITKRTINAILVYRTHSSGQYINGVAMQFKCLFIQAFTVSVFYHKEIEKHLNQYILGLRNNFLEIL